MVEVQNTKTIEHAAVDTKQSDGLRVVDLRKSFTGVDGELIEVLRGVMMEVKRGESVAIMGASGSGKSTLLHLLGGLEEADHGFINIGSTELTRTQPSRLADFRRRAIGFVFQFHYLFNDLTALENVAMPLMINRCKPSQAFRVAGQLLADIGLQDRANHPVTQLSGGEQQRIAVARAIINEPLLILADEPTGNLDAVIGDGIAKLLVDYARQHAKMAVIATHNERVANLCDRVLELKSGCLSSRG